MAPSPWRSSTTLGVWHIIIINRFHYQKTLVETWFYLYSNLKKVILKDVNNSEALCTKTVVLKICCIRTLYPLRDTWRIFLYVDYIYQYLPYSKLSIKIDSLKNNDNKPIIGFPKTYFWKNNYILQKTIENIISHFCKYLLSQMCDCI